jgi:hypothetical protein
VVDRVRMMVEDRFGLKGTCCLRNQVAGLGRCWVASLKLLRSR